MSLIQSTAIPSSATGYELDQSLRFEDSRSTFLSRTPAANGNRRTWTMSYWIKRGSVLDHKAHFGGSEANSESVALKVQFDGGTQQLQVANYRSGYHLDWICKSNMGFRDTSAWYHIVIAVDTTQGTASNRVKLYANGELLTLATATYPDQNFESFWNENNLQVIGCNTNNEVASNFYEGYMAEMNFLDGVVATPADFGETGTYGEWKPIEYSGSYGTNGFYLPFKQDYTVEGFSTVTWTGNGSTSANGRYIGGVGFNPDMVWIKCRTDNFNHIITNKAFGYNKHLKPNTTSAVTSQTHNIEGFQTDGFTLGHQGQVNANDDTFVAWNWNFGNTEITNNNGDITGYTMPNAAYGQSVVTYTGSGTSGNTVGHGLSAAPNLIIIKMYSGTDSWVVVTRGTGLTDYTGRHLNLDYAFNNQAYNVSAMSSTTFTLGNDAQSNASGSNYIAYCFANVSGYSKFGSYTGDATTNNSKSVTVGFQPAFLMVKKASGTGNWVMVDNTRNPNVNDIDLYLKADTNDVEATQSGNLFKFTSTGFTIGANLGDVNANGATYMYMAFADKREYAYWLDQSGNNNDWTSNNLTESDVMVDSPTNNFSTWNPLSNDTAGAGTLSEGSLRGVSNQSTDNGNGSTMSAFANGKTYVEAVINVLPSNGYIGICDSSTIFSGAKIYAVAPCYAYRSDGILIYGGGSNTSTDIATFAVGDIIQLAIDTSANKLWIGKNNVWQMSGTQNPSTGAGGYAITANIDYTIVHGGDRADKTINFGQDSSFAGARTAQGNQDSNDIGDFFYAPPTGFLALCTKNLPDVAVVPSENFNNVLWTGNNTDDRNITGVGFQPDFSWIKSRATTNDHLLFDIVRGVGKYLRSNVDEGNITNTNTLQAFASDGFQIGSDSRLNTNNDPVVAWNWKANGIGSSNTNGSINTIKTSANVDAGFSIISYTGNDTSGATIGHGLSKAPEMVLVKDTANSNRNWNGYHSGIDASSPQDYTIRLNSSNARLETAANAWNDTAPSASLVTLGGGTQVNYPGDIYIAYCFHSVDGYSKVGFYKGNSNADGTFVYTGFRPAFVMAKVTGLDESWRMVDSKRGAYNVVDEILYPNTNGVEAHSDDIDLLSNGFKLRKDDYGWNTSGYTYIYLAFAETPFKYSNAR